MFEVDSGRVLKFLLNEGMTVKEFSRRADVSSQAVKNAINGRKLHIPSVAKIAAVMGIAPNDLIVGK